MHEPGLRTATCTWDLAVICSMRPRSSSCPPLARSHAAPAALQRQLDRGLFGRRTLRLQQSAQARSRRHGARWLRRRSYRPLLGGRTAVQSRRDPGAPAANEGGWSRLKPLARVGGREAVQPCKNPPLPQRLGLPLLPSIQEALPSPFPPFYSLPLSRISSTARSASATLNTSSSVVALPAWPACLARRTPRLGRLQACWLDFFLVA